VEVARRYVAAMGGADAAVAVARAAFDEGDLRWAVEVLNHVLFADEHHAEARALQADAFERLAFGAENGTWRNAFLSGARELRHGGFGTPTTASAGDIVGALSVEQVFGVIGIRIDGPKAWDEHLVLSWVITDEGDEATVAAGGTTHVVEIRNGVLNQRVAAEPAPGSTTFTLSRPSLIGLVTLRLDLAQALADGTVVIDGDPADLGRLVAMLGQFDRDFAIVTP
jgi:alkyl sulfatase BDS1-like metallo-beta-lactamase superfamily hydrolase